MGEPQARAAGLRGWCWRLHLNNFFFFILSYFRILRFCPNIISPPGNPFGTHHGQLRGGQEGLQPKICCQELLFHLLIPKCPPQLIPISPGQSQLCRTPGGAVGTSCPDGERRNPREPSQVTKICKSG